jgi:hypothetical protein
MPFPSLILPILSGLGSIFGGAAKAKQDAKIQQADMATQQGNLALNAYNTDMTARAKQASDISTQPTNRLQQGALGNMVSEWTPSKVNWGGAGTIPQISGGFSDLKFNDSTKQSADLMQKDALLRQMQGQTAPDITVAKPVPDVMANFPSNKTSFLDQLLGWGGLLGSAAGAFSNSTKKPTVPIIPPTDW